MAYRLEGVRRAIAVALGLSPVVGCTERVIEVGGEFGASSAAGSSSGPESSSGLASTTTDPTDGSTGTTSFGSEDDGGESSSGGVATTGGPILPPVCNAETFPQVVICVDASPGAECVCDEGCMWDAASMAYERYPEFPGCYYPGTVTCTEDRNDGSSCCFTVALQYEDFCGEGRPLMIEGTPRVAPLVPCSEWSSGEPALMRPAVAAYWLQVASFEHASVASFARFALELTAVGAPPQLLAGAARAMSDEVRHARLAFELARRFGADAVGPGPLDAGPSRSTTLRDVVVATIFEGCVGETIAAAQAELAAARASDAEVVRALAEIAADEARHAALAWRVVQWALGVDPSLRSAVAEAFAEAVRLDVRPSTPPPEGLQAFGMLGAEALVAVRTRTLEETVRPFAAALLSWRPTHESSVGPDTHRA